MNEKPLIDFIEYGEGDHPHSVVTGGGATWDFTWVESEGDVFYHESGGYNLTEVELPVFVAPPAPPFKIYIRPGLAIKGGGSPEQFAALGLERIAEPLCDPFEDGREGEVVYCQLCGGPFWTERLCEHVWWEDGSGIGYVGPGADEDASEEISRGFVAWWDSVKHIDCYHEDDWKHGAWRGWRVAKGGTP